MAELDEIYNSRILEAAGKLSHTARLTAPDATASAHSKLCGSTITVDVSVRDGRIAEFGQTVKACLLGQAAASIVAANIIGTTPAEFAAIAATMRAMLKADGAPPAGRWADLAMLEPVRAYKARHASTLLVFDAVEQALTMSLGKAAAAIAAQ